uniref:Uncharacterized protein n=1 Tax=Caulobacter phage BL57 TaxID=3348355 RepID=A0AB74UGY6_9VIRU
MFESFYDRVRPAWSTSYSEVMPYIEGVSPPVHDGQIFVDRPHLPRGVSARLGIVDYSGVRRGDTLIYTTTLYPHDYIDRLHHKFSALPVIVNTMGGPSIGYAKRFHADHGPIFVEVEDARPGIMHSYPCGRSDRPRARTSCSSPPSSPTT